ncbi:MAG TPA: DNA gyrase subunit A [Thermoanaerobaculia bacterium]|nr:DNA gyrase subunit A [Thermoanaerobaculia bacterium]
MSDYVPPTEVKYPVNIEDEMKKSYLDYAMSVIIGRALPDVRDGLKPVHRRILYGMYEQGNTSGKAYKKSARIVGDVMGKFHPHGDSAIYDSIVRMAQDFSMRYRLVDGQGNFGSLDGDNPAAMRYTEVRLTKLAEELLKDDIDKETVDWHPNYDGSLVEPAVLPAKYPNLLVNGSSGIAVGMATNIPPHNLSEVVDACLKVIENPDVSVTELMTVMPGPDFPTAGFIHGLEGIRQAYDTGRGIIQVRARAVIETQKKNADRQSIVINEIPFMTNKARLIEKIAELVREKRIDGISDLRDESDRDGIRVVVELKKGEVGEVVLNNLYKLTQMQTTFGIIFLAIVDNQPRVLRLPELLRHFIDHRKDVVVRRTRFDLRKAEERAHILEGLVKALDHIEEIINLIRTSENPAAAKEQLIAQFAFSALQAQAILEMRLQRLTGLERDKIVTEYQDVLATIRRLKDILASEKLVLGIISDELMEIKRQFGDKRRTEIIAATRDISIEDMIVEEDMVITVSRGGYIKRSALSLYREQHRGGKGKLGMAPKEEDIVEHLFVASTHSYILVFTDRGRLHWLKVHEIPQIGSAARGKAIVNLINVEPDENVRALLSVKEFDESRYVVMLTRAGKIKKTALKAFSNVRAAGIIAIDINEGDDLHSVDLSDGDSQIFIGTHLGMAIRFHESDVRPMGRGAAGVKAINLRKGDEVVELDILENDTVGDALTITEGGFGKRTAVTEYRLQTRGGVGVSNIRITEKNGKVAAVKYVRDEDQVLLITSHGKMIRVRCSSIRSIGRATQGVRVINLDEGDSVVAAVKLVDPQDDELQDIETPDVVSGEEPEAIVEGEDNAEMEIEPEDPDTIH